MERIDLNFILTVAGGIILWIGGWLIFRLSRYLVGAVVGASLGYAVGAIVVAKLPELISQPWRHLVMLGSILTFTVVGSMLVDIVVKALLFFGGLVFGNGLVAFYYSSSSQVGNEAIFSINTLINHLSVWSVAAGIFCGVIFVFMEKTFLIIYTSAIGAYILVAQLKLPWMIFYPLIAIGVIVQFFLNKFGSNRRLELAELEKKNIGRDRHT